MLLTLSLSLSRITLGSRIHVPSLKDREWTTGPGWDHRTRSHYHLVPLSPCISFWLVPITSRLAPCLVRIWKKRAWIRSEYQKEPNEMKVDGTGEIRTIWESDAKDREVPQGKVLFGDRPFPTPSVPSLPSWTGRCASDGRG